MPDEDLALALYDATQEMTAAAGMPAYEISNHAAPGEESRHNLLYWRYGEYAGIGPGAHGRLLLAGVRHATSTERNPEAWAGRVEAHGHGIIEETPLAAPEEADEMLLMGLRLGEGVDLDRLERGCGARPSAAAVAELTQQGLIEAIPASSRIRATGSGRFILNEIVLRLAMSFTRSPLPLRLPPAAE